MDQAHDYAHEHSLAYLYPLVDYAQGCVAEALGEVEAALQDYARAEEAGLALGMRPLVWQARARAARAYVAAGKPDDAVVKRRAARQVIDEIAARFQDRELQTMFLAYAERKLG